MRRFGLTLLLCGLLTACGGGGSPAGNNGGGGNGQPTTANLSGYALAADGDLVSGQAPVALATAEVFALPAGAALATSSSDLFGSFLFSQATSNAVPLNQTLRVVVRTADRLVSAIFNSGSSSVMKQCDDVTHIAALAMLAAGATTYTDAQIQVYEIAARARLAAALVNDPAARFSLVANQVAAAALADLVRQDVAAGITANTLPQVGTVTTSPTQFVVQGGTVNVSLTATDDETLYVVALVLRPGATAPEAVVLSSNGDTYTGSFTVPDNDTTALERTAVYIIVDDGRHAPVPQTVRTIVVRPDGQFVLDILTETLFDEPASRAQLDAQLDRMRPVYHRGDSRASRQVNANQTIRGVSIALVDNPALTGTTGNDGLLLLQVPLSLLNDRLIGIDASISGRVPYRQYLVLPPDLAPQENDRIEVDLVLATEAQWQQVATGQGLGTLNYGLAPLTAFFNVRNDVALTGATPQAQSFRPITSTVRADDGDHFFSNLPVGPLTVQGTFTDPVDNVASQPFGPVELTMAAGRVHAVSALLPPN